MFDSLWLLAEYYVRTEAKTLSTPLWPTLCLVFVKNGPGRGYLHCGGGANAWWTIIWVRIMSPSRNYITTEGRSRWLSCGRSQNTMFSLKSKTLSTPLWATIRLILVEEWKGRGHLHCEGNANVWWAIIWVRIMNPTRNNIATRRRAWGKTKERALRFLKCVMPSLVCKFLTATACLASFSLCCAHYTFFLTEWLPPISRSNLFRRIVSWS